MKRKNSIHTAAIDRKIVFPRKRTAKKKAEILFLLATILTLSLIFAAKTQRAGMQAETSGTEYKYYTSIEVQPGECLWTIAGRYADEHYRDKRDYVREVMNINHLTDDTIRSGNHLIVPYYSTEKK